MGLGYYWQAHDQRYAAGLEKHPFFSWGGNRVRRTAPQKAIQRNKATQAEIEAGLRRVVSYTHNYDVAQRLLNSTLSTYSGRPFEWCVEKTIHDLIRDRR